MLLHDKTKTWKTWRYKPWKYKTWKSCLYCAVPILYSSSPVNQELQLQSIGNFAMFHIKTTCQNAEAGSLIKGASLICNTASSWKHQTLHSPQYQLPQREFEGDTEVICKHCGITSGSCSLEFLGRVSTTLAAFTRLYSVQKPIRKCCPPLRILVADFL